MQDDAVYMHCLSSIIFTLSLKQIDLCYRHKSINNLWDWGLDLVKQQAVRRFRYILTLIHDELLESRLAIPACSRDSVDGL